MENKHNHKNGASVIIIDNEEKDRFFRAVTGRLLSGILIFQRDRVLYSNSAFQQLVGFTEEKIMRIDPFDLVHASDRDFVRRIAVKQKKLSLSNECKLRILDANGRSRWVRVLATSINYKCAPAVMANFLYMDDRKHMEKHEGKADHTMLSPKSSNAKNGPKRKRNRKRKLTALAVRGALYRTNGNRLQAAKLLGVHRSTLYRYLSHYSNLK